MSTNPHKYTFRTLVEAFKHPPGDASGFISDDFPWSDEALILELLNIRSSLLTSAIDGSQRVSQQPVQILDCVEFEEGDRNECPCELPSGCYWSKSKLPLPKFIKISAVTGMIPNEQQPVFNQILWHLIKYIPSARSNAQRKGKYWTTRDTGGGRHLYLIGDRFLEKGSITGVWENPMEAAAFPRCGKVDKQLLCNPMDTEVYTDSELINVILMQAWAKLLPTRQRAPADKKNNDQANL